jgi:dynein intermediate chain
MTPRFTPDLIDVQQELFEFPQRVRWFLSRAANTLLTVGLQERVTYNKEIQTADIEPDTRSTSNDDFREHVTRERELTVDPERALEEESAILDREIEEEIRGLSTSLSLFRPSIERTYRSDRRRKN